ncbi:hypothetical protein AMAG_08746 [Allomyces macrogynus ATCC 38327]|uniref:Uncharacterized protein n=1 Tax=Allomyces macrogynus (strain ATCC 38327) TaxID=578462 RepID=A0A0L0SME1_ALLM3|nr:hypothetical protein AMAG_08746 [Allomyces macrogynus ATCC 38327]|eukprot:KNE63643.1 hypothetical protein AMAG_08746 [Allomyces macrogynus ATCC 38327]
MHPLHAPPAAAMPAAPGVPMHPPTVGDPRWLPHAHATITSAMAHSLACLHLWDDMHHAHALLRRDADTLNEHARSIDQHMAALDKRSRRLARQEDKLARRVQRLDRAMAQFDAARAAWCRAAGLPSDTYAVQPAEDGDDGSDASDSEDEDQVDNGEQQQRDAGDAKLPSSSPPAAPTTANSMVGGLVGSAWKSIDRAYAVRSKLGAVPLVGSLVQSALPENETDEVTTPPDSDSVSAPAAAAVAPPPTLPYAPYAPYYLYYPGGAGGAITPPTSIPDGTTGSPRAPSVSTTSRVRSAAGAVLRRAASVASLSLGSTPAAAANDAHTTSPTPTHAAMYPYYAPPHAHAHAHAHMMYAAPPMPYAAPAAYTPPQVHPAPTVDEFGHLVQSMASVASVANSVTGGAASPAGVVKSVGGWALNKVLGGGSRAGGSTTGTASG